MNILVIDVAAENSGALTILNQFISEFESDKVNRYIVVLSTIEYNDRENIKFINFKWVKKSHFHRLFFDKLIVPRLLEKFKINKIFSLQNNAYNVRNIQQEVYYQNILPLSSKRFSVFESKVLWFYQQIIGRIIKYSLKYANTIIVQAEWIKIALTEKWHINKDIIFVKKPCIDIQAKNIEYEPQVLFYPASGYIYKNHITLLKALIPLWERYNAPEIRFTGKLEDLPRNCQDILNIYKDHVTFLGKLTKEEMIEQYRTSILVFPSYIETVGLPLLEAKAVGSDIIAADCMYAREAVGNYQKINYFSVFDIYSLSKIIEVKCQQTKII